MFSPTVVGLFHFTFNTVFYPTYSENQWRCPLMSLLCAIYNGSFSTEEGNAKVQS